MFAPRALLVVALAGAAHAAAAATFYVSLSGSNTPPYTNWSTAATNLQYAVNTASNGDTVLVTNGAYGITGQVAVTRGIVVSSVNGAALTRVSGLERDRCLYVAHTGAVVEGFTFTGGATADRGGGAWLDSAGRLANCIVRGNRVTQEGGRGGGVFLSGEAELIHCTVSGNAATNLDADGGGVYLYYGGIVRGGTLSSNTARRFGGGAYSAHGGRLEGCRVRTNSATAGGGIYCTGGGTVYACTIEQNAAGGQAEGGGVYLDAAELVNCVVVSNVAMSEPSAGGGVYAFGACAIQNCTIATNTAYSGGGLFVNATSAVRNTIVYFNTAATSPNFSNRYASAAYTNSCTWPAASGAGNITNDPCFVNPAIGDYRIQHYSGCVDAGHPDGAPPDDRLGVSRPLDGDGVGGCAWDIGAHEYAHPAVDSDGDGLSDGAEVNVYATDPLDVDTDGDRSLDGDEIQAGTAPTNAQSFFGVVALDPRTDTNGPVVTWTSVAGKTYRLERGPDARAYPGVVATNLGATAPLNTYTDAAAPRAGPWLYRVALE